MRRSWPKPSARPSGPPAAPACSAGRCTAQAHAAPAALAWTGLQGRRAALLRGRQAGGVARATVLERSSAVLA